MSAQRMMFLTQALVIFLGIWLTGFEKASWIFYLMVVGLSFAGLTGICPNLSMWKKLGFNDSCSLPNPRK